MVNDSITERTQTNSIKSNSGKGDEIEGKKKKETNQARRKKMGDYIFTDERRRSSSGA